MGNTSLRRVIAEMGGDLETILRERAEDKKLFESYGLTLPEWYGENAGENLALTKNNAMLESEDDKEDADESDTDDDEA